MNAVAISLAGTALEARGSGALWWPERRLLAVSDLHLGKSGRIARLGGAMLPPYETADTLARLEAEIRLLSPSVVVCLGDSFDDGAAAGLLAEEDRLWLTRLQAGRRWIWVSGNHDPGPLDLGGALVGELVLGPLTFRHIALATETAEISGHYHPKAAVHARGRSVVRPCFLIDADRLILPAFGTFTGGLRSEAPVLQRLMRATALAVLTGPQPCEIPMPRQGNVE